MKRKTLRGKKPRHALGTLEHHLLERDQALAALDLDWARTQYGPSIGIEELLVHLHKARYECVHIVPALRHDSRRWLEERGHRRMADLPWPKDNDELP